MGVVRRRRRSASGRGKRDCAHGGMLLHILHLLLSCIVLHDHLGLDILEMVRGQWLLLLLLGLLLLLRGRRLLGVSLLSIIVGVIHDGPVV